MICNIVRRINTAYDKRLGNIISIENQKYDYNFISLYLKEASELTEEEKREITLKWGGVIPYIPRGYDFYKALKFIDTFSSDYLPSSYYFPIIESALNPTENKFELSHKGLSELLYKGLVKVPYTVLRTYNGMYLDYSYHPVTPKRAAEILKAETVTLLFKPAKLTVQGMGISLLDRPGIVHLANNIQQCNPIGKYSEFVVQRLVNQSNETKIFNSSSLNCMRITTLNLNGKISVCTRALKCGSENSIVDNIGTGKNGVAVGINEDGSLCTYGYYGNGERTTIHNGVEFHGRSIKNFDKIIDKAKELHSVNSVCKIIGWDLALDENDDIVLIEGNAAHPGISVEQIATGPVFGTRTDEVIDYVANLIKKH